MKTITSVLALGALATASAAAAQPSEVSVVTAGSEQALRVGKVVINRPFGAQLVDRIAVVGAQRVARRVYTLVRGDAAGECPSRYVIVYREDDGTAATTEPFGTCSSQARLRASGRTVEVVMPAALPGGAPARFRFAQGSVQLIGAAASTDVAGGVPVPGGYAPGTALSCPAAGMSDGVAQAAMLADFEADYPEPYRRLSTLKKADIAPDDLRDTVTSLACLSTLPGAEKSVPRLATPLFASKRHGPAAFAELERVAIDPLADANLRAVVRAFSAEMVYRVERRNPL